MRSGSTSGRRWRYSIAALTSASPPQPQRVRLALALALAAAVEQQHAVAVAGEHAGLLLRAVAAGEGDHRGAVARRDVPAAELEVVGRGERHVLVRDAQVVRRHDRAADVGRGVAQAHHRHHEGGDQRRRADRDTPRVAPPQAALGAARAPQLGDADAEQRQRGRQREQPGEVVARGADLPGVVEGLDPGRDPEDPGRERERSAPSAAEPRVGPRGEADQGQRDQAAGEMVGRRRAGLGLEPVVVDDVDRDRGERDPECGGEEHAASVPARAPPRLGARSCPDAGRQASRSPGSHRTGGSVSRRCWAAPRRAQGLDAAGCLLAARAW